MRLRLPAILLALLALASCNSAQLKQLREENDALKAEIENPEYDALNKLFDLDVGAARIISRKSALRRLLVFQREMLCFVIQVFPS